MSIMALTLIGLGSNPPFGHHKSQEFPSLNGKDAFGRVESHSVSAHDVEACPEIVMVRLLLDALNKHVVYIRIHGSAEQSFEKHVYHSLISCSNIPEAK